MPLLEKAVSDYLEAQRTQTNALTHRRQDGEKVDAGHTPPKVETDSSAATAAADPQATADVVDCRRRDLLSHRRGGRS